MSSSRCLMHRSKALNLTSLYSQGVRPVFLRRNATTSAAGDANERIRTQLKTDLKSAMRAKNTNLSNVIKSVLSDITYAEKASNANTTLSVATLIQRSLKKRKDSAEAYRTGGREDLAAKEEEECKLLEAYLPKQMTEDELIAIVKEIINKSGASGVKDLGKVMKQISSKVDDAVAPKKLVADVVKKVLQSLP
ncbi:hypothetical protein PhCBS80983_g03968 [Powellomyces hirtus]|uniref:Altered inheritance of mitochondria protein 41 n=1 Tax=Powellomyces hirtus TaxID=109895 RepID=A0A507E0C1_9FUNG|nr:hypothetical protein PhCBS80983_g03968 [Powellomyces hirtus]